MKALLDIVARHKAGANNGIYAVCSAHPLVLRALFRQAQDDGSYALIEATSNQVNQYGGYTGMQPERFRDFVHALADAEQFPRERVLLGGDHLGPNCWQQENAKVAMEKAEVLIAAYVAAGFRKIHLDCSMSCAGDPFPLSDAVVAERASRLCAVAEAAWRQHGGEAPVYVIGTEVPVPGGAAETLRTLQPTSPVAARTTLLAHDAAWQRAELADAWNRVIALVVQPGVEFDHHQVIDYQPLMTRDLSAALRDCPLIYEAHSTDYQTPASLAALVRDHFAILKVGPGVTFALREALFMLDAMLSEWQGEHWISLRAVMRETMREQPQHWRKYYSDDTHIDLTLLYSLSDRIRYYWPLDNVNAAVNRLFLAFDRDPPPLPLLSQYGPCQHARVRRGELEYAAEALVIDRIREVLAVYASACYPKSDGQ